MNFLAGNKLVTKTNSFLLLIMEITEHEEIFTYFKHGIFPFKLPKGSAARKNWAYYIRNHYKLHSQVLTTATLEKLAVARKVKNLLGM